MARQKERFGDIFEIETPAGLAYFQYTHFKKGMGGLVRVLPGLFSERPSNFAELAMQRELYFVFYPLGYALRDGKVQRVSNQPIPEWAIECPLMRWAGFRDEAGRVTFWKIFRACDLLTLETHERTPAIPKLTPEQERLSVYCIRGHEDFVKELARGWTPERDEEFRLRDVADAEARKRDEGKLNKPPSVELMQHFLYFSDRSKAMKTAQILRDKGFSVEVRKGPDPRCWLTLAEKGHPATGTEMDKLRTYLEALATDMDGEYDGWQMAVDSIEGWPIYPVPITTDRLRGSLKNLEVFAQLLLVSGTV